MKKIFFAVLFFFLASFANAQPCGLTLVTLYTYTAGCGVCNDTIVVAGIGGTGPLTFLWSDGQTNDTAVGLCPGTFTCTVTDSLNCTSTGIFTLTSSPPPIVIATFSNASCDSCCDGIAIANASGGTLPYSFLWSDNETTDTAHDLCPGKYFVCVTDVNGCSSCDTVDVGSATGIYSMDENNFISVFPNPAADKINLSLSGDLLLTDMSGRVVRSDLNSDFMDVGDLSDGIYFLIFSRKDEIAKRIKIIKQ